MRKVTVNGKRLTVSPNQYQMWVDLCVTNGDILCADETIIINRRVSCTCKKGHTSPHVAHGANCNVVAVWDRT